MEILGPLPIRIPDGSERSRAAFARSGRLHLPDVLPSAAAERLATALETKAPWVRAVGGSRGAWDVPLDAISGREPQLAQAAYAEARTGFQFLFDIWRHRPGSDVILDGVHAALNSPAFLAAARRLTGEARIAYCDVQATRYLPGHFLTTHDDDATGKNRLFAYVLNLTQGWRADWGGLLLFHRSDGHVEEGYTPAFNALNIFRVPQPHSVSLVAPFAAAPRLSVTGWMRAAAD